MVESYQENRPPSLRREPGSDPRTSESGLLRRVLPPAANEPNSSHRDEAGREQEDGRGFRHDRRRRQGRDARVGQRGRRRRRRRRTVIAGGLTCWPGLGVEAQGCVGQTDRRWGKATNLLLPGSGTGLREGLETELHVPASELPRSTPVRNGRIAVPGNTGRVLAVDRAARAADGDTLRANRPRNPATTLSETPTSIRSPVWVVGNQIAEREPTPEAAEPDRREAGIGKSV